jgi:histidine triad (HIT) family protein
MPHDPDYVFCQIVADTGKCLLLADDLVALAFMDIHPANPGHCLVIPKGHWPTVLDTPGMRSPRLPAWWCALPQACIRHWPHPA